MSNVRPRAAYLKTKPGNLVSIGLEPPAWITAFDSFGAVYFRINIGDRGIAVNLSIDQAGQLCKMLGDAIDLCEQTHKRRAA